MSNNRAAETGDNSLIWIRLAGGLLVLGGAVLNKSALGWLLTADQSIDSSFAATAILALQALLVLAGLVLLIRPILLASLTGFTSILLGVSGVIALIGVIASIGETISPPVDMRVANYPEFSCATSNSFCNTAKDAGLMDVQRYGKGVAFADINGDGWIDLYAADAEPRLRDDWGVSSFYLNKGDGSFEPVDLGISSDDLDANWNGSFADMDNDGDQDLLLVGGGYAGEGRLSLYENRMDEADRFVSVTAAAGLDVENSTTFRWWGISWADYDDDGYLDFALSRLYAPALLFHNNGDGTFANVTVRMGVVTTGVRDRDGKNIVWFDYDNDGDLDLYLAGIQAHNMFENLEGKYLLDITEQALDGVFPENLIYEKGAPVVFSAAAADFNQDGLEDLYFGRQIEQDLVLFNNGDGGFSAYGKEVGIDTSLMAKNQTRGKFENTMGLGVGDLFDDGWPDVIIGSGDPVRADEDVVFCNDGGRFERCTEVLRAAAKGDLRTRTHGVAFGDVNQDGHADVFQNFGGHAPWDQKSGIDSREHGALFVANSIPANSNTATVILQGVTGNRDAIGARIKSMAESVHYYTVRSTQAFQSQNDKAVILALGNKANAELEITWPGGAVTTAVVQAGSRTNLREKPAD